MSDNWDLPPGMEPVRDAALQFFNSTIRVLEGDLRRNPGDAQLQLALERWRRLRDEYEPTPEQQEAAE